MANPEAGLEQKRLKELQKEIVTGEIMAPMLIKIDSHGERTIEEVKGVQESLTIERVRELQELDPVRHQGQLAGLPTHEKVLWLKLKLDKQAPNVTAGANEITVSRENLLADSLSAFNTMSAPHKVLRVTF